MTRGLTIALAVAVCQLAACRREVPHGAAEEGAERALVGAWDATFTRIGPDGQPLPGEVRGTIALVRDRDGRVWSPQLSTPDECGAYDIDFRAFGFDPRDGESIPTVIATVDVDSAGGRPADHVRMVLHPGDARVAVILDGVLARGTVTGTWQTDSRSASGAGRFTLARHEL